MARLRGTGLGAGMAMGTAAVVRTRAGVPLVPEAPARILAQVASRRLSDVPEVVLVADTLRAALSIGPSLGWAQVVAIAAEQADPDAPVPPFPAVVGVAGLMNAASEDMLVLVDATRGIALIDPDPIYLAQYTAEHDRIAPKHRIYLDEAHLPAQTLDGRTISVIAATEGGVEPALASGPDSLYHSPPLTFDPQALRRHLADVGAVAAGKPLILPYNASLPLAPLLEAAAHADVTFSISASDGAFLPTGDKVESVLREIEATQAECDERDVLYGSPRISAEAGAEDAAEWPSCEALVAMIESVAAAGATRLILSGRSVPLDRLQELAATASVNLMPVTLASEAGSAPFDALLPPGDDLAESVRLAIGAGVSAFLVTPALTAAIKAAVRETSASEASEELARSLRSSG